MKQWSTRSGNDDDDDDDDEYNENETPALRIWDRTLVSRSCQSQRQAIIPSGIWNVDKTGTFFIQKLTTSLS